MIQQHYETTLGRAAVALLTGAIVGPRLVLLGTMGSMAFYSSSVGGLIGAPSERIVNIITLVFVYAFVSFAGGLAILGAPLWWLFHRLGRRSWIDALILGVVLSFACSLFLTTRHFLWPAPGSNYSSWDSGGALVINNSLTAHG